MIYHFLFMSFDVFSSMLSFPYLYIFASKPFVTKSIVILEREVSFHSCAYKNQKATRSLYSV